VPIRLVLQPIDETRTDLDAGAAGAPRPDPEPAPVEDTASSRAAKLRDAAVDKRDAGDGAGCLADLDRADGLAQAAGDALADVIGLRGTCTMAAGDCKRGAELLLEAVNMADADKTSTPLHINAAVSRAQMKFCPLEQLEPRGRGSAAFYRVRDARAANKPKLCDELGEAMLVEIARAKQAGEKPDSWATDTLGEVRDCLWARGDCEASKRWHLELYTQIRRDGVTKDEAREAAAQMWTKMHDETGCSN
jgi:hypothetical protein